MIYCVAFAEFAKALRELGFVQAERSERSTKFVRGDDTLTVRSPNVHGDITEQAALAACDAAGIEPPPFDVHWCD